MELEGEGFGARDCLKVCASSSEWSNLLRRHGEPIIAPPPQGNLPIGVSETRTCPIWGLDKSDNPLWNPAWELDMSGSRALTRDKAERLDMSGLRAKHVQETSLEPG
jgi:hypothetical protein